MSEHRIIKFPDGKPGLTAGEFKMSLLLAIPIFVCPTVVLHMPWLLALMLLYVVCITMGRVDGLSHEREIEKQKRDQIDWENL